MGHRGAWEMFVANPQNVGACALRFPAPKPCNAPTSLPIFGNGCVRWRRNAAVSGLWLLAWCLQEHRQKAAQQKIQITQ